MLGDGCDVERWLEAARRDEGSESDVKRLVRERGRAYYFSHETIKNYESGEIEFVDYDEYVDQETGEDTCRYHPNAIDKESYEESS